MTTCCDAGSRSGGWTQQPERERCECHQCTQARLPTFERQMNAQFQSAQALGMVTHFTMVSQIDAAVLAERERCAKIADEWADSYSGNDPFLLHSVDRVRAIAAKIREGK